mgnify:CR=1 FL=1
MTPWRWHGSSIRSQQTWPQWLQSATSRPASRLSECCRRSAAPRGYGFLDALGEAALEISGQLPGGSHRGAPRGPGSRARATSARRQLLRSRRPTDGLTSRITLRLPESLKASIEADAAREGISVNSLIVRALFAGARAVEVQRSGKTAPGLRPELRRRGESDGDQVLSTAFRTCRSARSTARPAKPARPRRRR